MRVSTVPLVLLLAVSLWMTPCAVWAGEAPETAFANTRHVYERGEQCTLLLSAPDCEAVEFDVSGWLPTRVPVVEGQAKYPINTLLLRAQDYVVRARPIADGIPRDPVLFQMTVAPPHDEERIPVWRWGGGGGDMEWWMARGFTGGFGGFYRGVLDPSGTKQAHNIAETLEQAARNDFDMGFYFCTLSSKPLQESEPARTLFPDGSRHEKKPYPLEPEVIKLTQEVTESWLERFHDYPGLRHVMFNSEWQQPFCVNEPAVQMAEAELGLDIREFVGDRGGLTPFDTATIENGIIEDDHPRYRFLTWWWQRGHGTALLNQIQNEIVKKHNPSLLTWHEPYRLAPIHKSHSGLDCIATWTYGFPDIKRLCYTTYLQAAARPENQLVQQDITLFVYGYMSVPLGESTANLSQDFAGKDPYFTAGPDYAREAIWLVLSQRPDILCFYSAGSLNPANPTLDPFITSPETFHAIGQECEHLVKPYGPAIRACTRAKPAVALLMSAAATWFRATSSAYGYATERTLPFATLLMMNHVPFDVLLDDDIANGALENYEVLVIPKADTITRSMHNAILAFVEAGGKVIADKSLRAPIPEVQITDYDFTHQRRISGKALAQGNAVTAEEDRAIVEGYAKALAPLLAEVPRAVNAQSPRVLTNTLEGGAITYHFFINDDRTYGPRFGQWKLRFELGVPQKAYASIALQDGAVIYNVLRRTPITYETADGRANFDLALPPARGALVAVLPEPIGRLEIAAPEEAVAGESVEFTVTVLGESGRTIDGVFPLRIDVLDPLGRQTEWSRYTATQAGTLTRGITLALNIPEGAWTIRATDLISGKIRTAEIQCLP